MAESLLRGLGGARFVAHSAGSHPSGRVHPMALDLLARRGLPVAGLRSKAWDEFTGPAAPPMDVVITVCDNAAGEVCPIWPGHPHTAHWGIPDPAAVTGNEESRRAAFAQACATLEHRVAALVRLPLEGLSSPAITDALRDIGRDGA
ncbi:MAG: arsenate reductase ArsC [Proteobacteria bacterium]|nr:arsenate reductase ArsC [Pseudomonadota bacterium]